MLGLALLLSALVLGGERVRITKRTDEKSDREDGCVLPSYIYLVVKKFLENGALPRVSTVTTLRTCDGDQRLDIEISIPSLDRFTNKHITLFYLPRPPILRNARGNRRSWRHTLSMVFPPEEDSRRRHGALSSTSSRDRIRCHMETLPTISHITKRYHHHPLSALGQADPSKAKNVPSTKRSCPQRNSDSSPVVSKQLVPATASRSP